MSRDDGDGDLPPAASPAARALARVQALDVRRVARADPIYPGTGGRSLRDGEAAAIATATRSQLASRRGDLVAPRSALPDEPALVADALIVTAEAGMLRLGRDDLRAAQRDLAETLVDLQSFRPDEEAERILSDPTGAVDELESLRAARAAIIAMLRDDDLSIVGNMNALRELDVRIGDGRVALDAVDRYRVKQALSLLAVAGFPVVVGVVVAAIILILVIGPTT
jgi:hypothetical protein